MTSFGRIVAILDHAVGGSSAPVGAHGPFWRGLTRDQFVQKRVFGRPLVTLGDGAGSNLVKALKGEAPFGSDIGTPGASFRRMPAGRPPVGATEIAEISGWIDAGCPAEDEPPAPVERLGTGSIPASAWRASARARPTGSSVLRRRKWRPSQWAHSATRTA